MALLRASFLDENPKILGQKKVQTKWHSLLKELRLCVRGVSFGQSYPLKLEPYRVSQKKSPHVSNCHYSFKISTRNKSRVSFEILRKSSCWWALKFFNLDFGGLRKWGLKLVTLYLKVWPNQTSSGPVCLWHIEKWKTPFTWVSIPLPQKNNWWQEVP